MTSSWFLIPQRWLRYLSPNIVTWEERWITDWLDTRSVFMEEPVFILITFFSSYWTHNLPSILWNLLCPKGGALLLLSRWHDSVLQMQYYVTAPSVLLWDYLLASNFHFVLKLLFKPHLVSETRQQWIEITNNFSFTKPGKEKHSRNTVSHGVLHYCRLVWCRKKQLCTFVYRWTSYIAFPGQPS